MRFYLGGINPNTMRLTTLVATCGLTAQLFAAHLPGGNITYRCTGGNVHEITLQLWRECSGFTMVGQDLHLTNSCGVSFDLTNIPLVSTEDVSPVCPEQQNQTTCNGGTEIGIQLYTYQTSVFLSPCAQWTIAWNICCRNPSVNLEGEQGTYIEAIIKNLGGACNESPTFPDGRPPFACVDQPVSYDPGVLYSGPHDLRFHLIDARRYTGVVEPVIYQGTLTGAEPYPGLVIDSLTGNISFTPTIQGYVVCVIEVRMLDANGVLVGSVMRDFPFVVQACSNSVPDVNSGTAGNTTGSAQATGPYEVSACSGGAFCMEISIADNDATQELVLSSNVDAVLTGATFNVVGTNPAVATICWDSGGAAPGTYNFSITAEDGACPVPGVQNYTYTVIIGNGAAANAGADGFANVCDGNAVDLSALLTGDAGGTWSAGPVVTDAGLYTYVVQSTCANDTAYFVVGSGTTPNAGSDYSATICSDSPIDLELFITGDLGGTWSSGSSVVNATGQYTYTVGNGCGSDDAVFDITAVDAPDAGTDNAIIVCANATVFTLLDSLLGTPDNIGSWTNLGFAHPPTFDPTVDGSGQLCYTVNGIGPCGSAQACLTITVLPADDPYCLTLGTTSLRRTEFRIVPNPSTGLLRIEGMTVAAVAVDVLDNQGRMLWRSANGSQMVPVIELPSSLTSGVYLLRLRTMETGWSMHRFELLR